MLSRQVHYCDCCKEEGDGFQELANLQKSGLVIYIHIDRSTKSSISRRFDVALAHNPTEKDVKRPSFMNELGQYKTNCLNCKLLLQRVRSLLNEIKDVRKSEAIAVCDHCKLTSAHKCERCEYIVKKFMNDKDKKFQQQDALQLLMCKLKWFLERLLEQENICQHKSDSASAEELTKLLRAIKSTSIVSEPQIEIFPILEKLTSIEKFAENKELLGKILNNLKETEITASSTSDDSLNISGRNMSSSCFCKGFKDSKLGRDKKSLGLTPRERALKEFSRSINQLLDKQSQRLMSKLELSSNTLSMTHKGRVLKDISGSINQLHDKQSLGLVSKEPHDIKSKIRKGRAPKETLNSMNQQPQKDVKRTFSKSNDVKDKTKLKGKRIKSSETEEHAQKSLDKNEKQDKKSKVKSSELDILKIMKNGIKKDKKPEKEKPAPKIVIPQIAALPTPVRLEVTQKVSEETGSVIECSQVKDIGCPKMIKGEKIVCIKSLSTDIESIKPLFEKEHVFSKMNSSITISNLHDTPLGASSKKTSTVSSPSFVKKKTHKEANTAPGFIYQLSNREYINKGWTILPCQKVMRRLNVYRMIPACPESHWFVRNYHKKIQFYPTGEKFADIDDNGCGRWYYKNGRVALDFYTAQEPHVDKRYVIYSDGVSPETGKPFPITVLAAFDTLGNGIVYDLHGKERLKYNQTEGAVIDRTIAPIGKWKWHMLNDPPVLEVMIVDNNVQLDPCFENIVHNNKVIEGTTLKVKGDDEIIKIELENLLKAKEQKLLQKFVPIQIRMKVMKLNHQFSLRVFDQSHVYLAFNEDGITIKMNIGMQLMNREIVDSDIVDVKTVETPYDRKLPRSNSVIEIQRMVGKAREQHTRQINKLMSRHSI